MEHLFARLDSINAQVNLCRSSYRWAEDRERWSCSIKYTSEDRTELETAGEGRSAQEALETACAKFFKAAARGVDLPLIVDHSTV